jgi:hypothetical protein
MNRNNISIKEADRQVYRSALDDGLVDIFLSSWVLMWAVAPYLSRFIGDFWASAIFLPVWGGLALLLYWVRKHIIRPRSGVVKYGPARIKKLSAFTWIMLALNVVFMLLGFVAFFMPTGPGWTRMLPFALMLLASFSLAGYFLDTTRFYVYGILIAGGFFVGEWLYQEYGFVHHGYPVVFGFLSLVVLLTGLYKLSTFIRNNPLPIEEELQWEGNNG